jgi:DnaJ-class molecular chaperone
MRAKPQRPFKNFGLFCWSRGARTGIPYPCFTCRGDGSLFHPQDPPCPVEGDKYRRIIRCPDCGGTGQGSKEVCLQAYREALAKWRAEKKEYDRLAEARKAALKTLTKEQIQALRELGI